MFLDISQVIETNATVHAIHENAVIWDEDTEFVFGFLQVTAHSLFSLSWCRNVCVLMALHVCIAS